MSGGKERTHGLSLEERELVSEKDDRTVILVHILLQKGEKGENASALAQKEKKKKGGSSSFL